MHKNRIILLLGIFIILVPESGFTPEMKKYLIEIMGILIVVFAFLVERHINISLHWRKKSPVTPTATTYVEHNGAVNDIPVNNQ